MSVRDRHGRVPSRPSRTHSRSGAERSLRERVRHFESLLRLSRNLEYAQTYGEAMKAAVDEVRRMTGYRSLWAYLLTEDQSAFELLSVEGLLTKETIAEKGTARLVIRGDRMLEEIAAADDVVVIEDSRRDERTNKELVARFENRTLVHVPVFLFDRRLGAISTGSFGEEGVRVPTASERMYLTALASHMAVSLDRIRLLHEQERTQAELRKLNEELEWRVVSRTRSLDAANREMESFVYSVAHDLRAPLTSIDAFSRLLLAEHEPALSPDALDCVNRIRGNAQHLQALVSALLELSRLSSRQMQAEPVDLSAIAREILDELRRTAPDRQVDAVVEPGLVVRADPVLMRTVLSNLMGNAWKYTTPRPVAHLEVGAQEVDRERVYFVRDNGVGFDMAQAPRLFAPFQRLHSPAEFPGSGIGLVSVRRVIARHGGRVWAKAAPDRGATFCFTLAADDSPMPRTPELR